MYFTEPRIGALLEQAEVVILDMNGLLIDDEPIQWEATNRALQAYGVQFTQREWAQKCVGRRAREFVAEALRTAGGPSDRAAEIVAAKEQFYLEALGSKVRALVRPGIPEFIAFIHNHTRKKLALASSASRANVHLVLGPDGLNAADQFDAVVCGQDVQHAKPDPEVFLAVQRVVPGAKQFLVFEDAEAGVLAAHRAGMLSVAVPNSFTVGMDFSLAALVISDLSPEARYLRSQQTTKSL